MSQEAIEAAKVRFGALLADQFSRLEALRADTAWTDYAALKPVVIGVCAGDGIGPEICRHASAVLTHLLRAERAQGRVEIRTLEGLTIENRARQRKAIPDDVLAAIKACHVLLKGPTTTPSPGDPWPNIESANVAMRRELDLFANVRPVKIARNRIDWCFFRENTEGSYILGSKGFDVTPDLGIDFCVATGPGTERILRMAFEYARVNRKPKVTVVTKSNVVKTTDGRFSRAAREMAREYEQYGIRCDEWFIDIMTAKLLDPARRSDFHVLVLPNLYGDILTDEAAQIQGGVGSAGSANIGKKWAMFEAIHGSAPRMVQEGRARFADPCSMIKAAAMLLRHIGFPGKADTLEMALDVASQFERRLAVTGREDGATAEDFTHYLLEWTANPALADTWNDYIRKASGTEAGR